MLNKKTLSLKMNKSFVLPSDAPFTPVDQTLRTPVDPPNNASSYFPQPPNHSLYSNPQYNESDDILTDVDEPSSKVMRSYSVAFTPLFDSLVLNIYTHILSLPTTTPFLGAVPPSGLVSRVANETFHSLLKNTAADSSVVYDTQSMLSLDHLRNHAYQPIFLQLIRKRLIDLCTVQRASNLLLPQFTSVQVPVPVGAPPVSGQTGSANGICNGAQYNNNANGYNGGNAAASHAVYNGGGLRQLSISNLLLNEQNVSNYNQLLAQVAQVAALNNSRLRLSSLSLRKHSLTRNNSYTGSNWLHVGNVQNIRSSGANGLGMNPDFCASNESLQLMHDYVPQAFIRLGALLSNLTQTAPNWNQNTPSTGFNSMMLDYHTPPSSVKSSILLGSTPPSVVGNRDTICLNSLGAAAEYEEFTQLLMRSRSSSRGNVGGLFPKPLTINTDTSNFVLSMNHGMPHGGSNGANGHINNGNNGAVLGETLNSPFVSATIPTEDVGYFGSNGHFSGLGNVLPGLGGLRSGPLIPESPGKDSPMANGNNKINLPGQYSLSEKKRDSLKLKRGIH